MRGHEGLLSPPPLRTEIGHGVAGTAQGTPEVDWKTEAQSLQPVAGFLAKDEN